MTNEIVDLNESEEAEMIRKRKLANRQQSIAMAARMKNIRTAVAFDIPDELDRLVYILFGSHSSCIIRLVK